MAAVRLAPRAITRPWLLYFCCWTLGAACSNEPSDQWS
jgi:hypothetical protein